MLSQGDSITEPHRCTINGVLLPPVAVFHGVMLRFNDGSGIGLRPAHVREALLSVHAEISCRDGHVSDLPYFEVLGVPEPAVGTGSSVPASLRNPLSLLI